MSSFIYTFFRGFYPPYLFFVVWGVAARVRARRWRPFDKVLLASFLVFEFFSAFQVWMFYGRPENSARYMLIAVPLYLPFAAEGVIGVWNYMKRDRRLRTAALAAFAVLAAVDVYNFYTPVLKQRALAKRFQRRISLRAATWIRNDWRPQPDPPGFDRMKCDQYRSGRRPLVRSEKPARAVGYMCGGQEYPEFFDKLGIPPDYIVTPQLDRSIPGYLPLGEVRAGGKTVYIFKRTTEKR